MLNIQANLLEITKKIEQNLDQIIALRNTTVLKIDNTPVTKADIYIQELVEEYLKENFSNFIFISEESYDYSFETLQDKLIVVLDPIDGTENFCSGLKEWGVSIGFWNGKGFLGGAIYLPEMNIKLVSGDKLTYHKSRIIGLSSSVNQSLIDNISVGGQYRIMGCAVYNIYNVVVGSYAKFINPKGVNIWDFLPGTMLALEHGCKVYIDGNPYYGDFLNPNKIYRIEIVR